MNAFTPPGDFSGQPDRAHDVIATIGRANHALGRALVPGNRRLPRQISERMLDVVKAIQFLPMYLDGVATINLKNALSDALGAIAALDAAVERDRRTIAGRFARWLHFRRHPEEYTVLVAAPTQSGKGVGIVIPSLADWQGPIQVHDPKADPNTLH